jgi:hypothetical protein
MKNIMKAAKIFFQIIISFFVVGLFSCVEREEDIRKDCENECTVLDGVIYTSDINLPLSDIPVELKWRNTPLKYGGKIRTVARGRTDKNGYYHFNIYLTDEELNEGYFLLEMIVDEQKYLTNPNEPHSFAYDRITRDSIITINYFIPLKAYIETGILNSQDIKSDRNDYFSSTFQGKFGIEGKQNYGTVITWSKEEPSRKLVAVQANTDVVIINIRRKDNISTTTYDTVKLKPLEKIVVQFEF